MEPAAPGTEDEIIDYSSLNKQETEQDRLLKQKGVLKNGQYDNIFELSYVNGAEHWFCKICECPIMGRVYQHELGKRHNSNLHLGNRYMKPQPQAETQEEVNHLEIAPGEPVPPGYEGEVNRSALIQERLDGFKVGPLVALEYLMEMHDFDPCKEPLYLCILCDKRGDPRTVLTHLASYNHISQYLQKHFPTCYRALAPYMTKQYKRNWQVTLQKIAEAIEKKFGRLKPFCIEKEKFENDRIGYLTMVNKGKHFSEQLGMTFVDLVVHDELTKVHEGDVFIDKSDPPSKQAAALATWAGKTFIEKPFQKRDPSPPVVAKPVKKPKVADNKASPRPTAQPRRRSLSSVSSISSDDDADSRKAPLKPVVNKATPKGREPFRKGPYDRDRNYRRKSPIPPMRRRSPSPYRRQSPRFGKPNKIEDEARQKLKEKDRLAKLEEFKRLLKAIDNDMEKSLKNHERNPEKHPKYNDEWKKFWNKRYKELQVQDKDPSKHDFKPEWINYWNKRMHELHQEELKERKEGLRRRLGLPDEIAPISFRIGGNLTSIAPPKNIAPPQRTIRPNMPMAARPDNDPEIIVIDDKDEEKRSKRESSPWEKESPPRKFAQSTEKSRRNPSPVLRIKSRSRSKEKRLVDNRLPLEKRRSKERSLEKTRSNERPLERRRSNERSFEKRRSKERSPERRRSRERSLDRRRSQDRPLERKRSIERPSERRRSIERPLEKRRSMERRRSIERTLERRRSEDRSLERRRSRSRELPGRRSRERSRGRRSRSPDTYRNSDRRSLEKDRGKHSRERSWERDRKRDYRESSYERDIRGRERVRTVADLPWERQKERIIYPRKMMSANYDDYYVPPPGMMMMREVTRKPMVLPAPMRDMVPPMRDAMSVSMVPDEEEDGGEVNIVSVLRLLTAVEERLGSLGPKVIDLLAQALALEKREANSSETLLDNEINCVMFETVKEKLKGQLLASLVEPMQERAFKKAIQKTANLIHISEQRKRQRALLKPPERAPLVVPGVGQVDKFAIAKQVANALVAQGKTDVTQAELEQLINAVVGMAEASKHSGKPMTTASFLESLAGGGSSQAAEKSKVLAAKPKGDDRLKSDIERFTEPLSPVGNEKSYGNMENLSDSDLQTLLQNFKDLSTEEQMNLINYLKKLELDEPDRVERLRKFVNLGSINSKNVEITESVDLDKEERSERDRSPFSNRQSGVNPEENIHEVKNIVDSEDEDYTYEDVVKSVSKSVKQQMEEKQQKQQALNDSQKEIDLNDAKALISNLMSNINKTAASNATVDLLGLGAAPPTSLASHMPPSDLAKTLNEINMDNLASIVNNVQSLTTQMLLKKKDEKAEVEEKKLNFEPPMHLQPKGPNMGSNTRQHAPFKAVPGPPVPPNVPMGLGMSRGHPRGPPEALGPPGAGRNLIQYPQRGGSVYTPNVYENRGYPPQQIRPRQPFGGNYGRGGGGHNRW